MAAETASTPQPQVESSADVVTQNTDATPDTDQLDPERKRRRRRSRRGRRNNEGGADLNTAAGSDEAGNEVDDDDANQAFKAHETPAFNASVLPSMATAAGQSGREACREGGGQNGQSTVDAVTLQK